jgi:sulfonate transport system ATP-binding protein
MFAAALRRVPAQDAQTKTRGDAPQPRGRGVALTLRGVQRGFAEKAVLRGLDLHISEGQFVAVVGKSGCGKSTLLRLIAGLDAPSAGEVRLADPSAARRIMFQEPRLLPWARVAENVEVGLGSAGTAATRRSKALEALRHVGLADRADDWPRVLSGGQKQRVALARALVSRPQLLAFDEPLGALDALTRIEMQRLIEEVWRTQGFTALLVTHDVNEAIALADRVVIVDNGVIVLDAPVRLARPRRRGDPAFAALEGAVLRHFFND